MMAKKEQAPRDVTGHRLADHSSGEELTHAHRPGEPYDHDHDEFDPGPLEDNPIWLQDHVSLVTVGVDIGSSTTNVIFSRLQLRRLGEDLSSRYFVTSRETLHQTPMAFTPYEEALRIDQVALGEMIDSAYHSAGLTPGQIDAGSVILTGEALRRENAELIATVVARQGGDFVCATAGHHMEAMLAVFGSGAAAASRDPPRRILNIDIGGGTTKLALAYKGDVVSTAALHVGGRLQVLDRDGRIIRLDSAGQQWARQAGFCWALGERIDPNDLDIVADTMATTLLAVVTGAGQGDPHALEYYLTEPLSSVAPIDGVMFSGGVGEYIYGREDRDFNDLGRRLGRALRARIDAGALPWPLLPAGECIRATAIGASEYSVQLTGNTLYASDYSALLPRRNLQVVRPPYEFPERVDPLEVERTIRDHLTLFDVDLKCTAVALAFQWQGDPSFERVLAFAQGVMRAMAPAVDRRQPLYLILDRDLAQTLGATLREELAIPTEVLVIDGIVLWDFDYIDLGKIRLPSHTVPVTVKSLIFNQDPHSAVIPHEPRHSHGAGHHHHPGHEHSHQHRAVLAAPSRQR